MTYIFRGFSSVRPDTLGDNKLHLPHSSDYQNINYSCLTDVNYVALSSEQRL